MELTPELKRRFCKNCNIPISIFVEPFFTDRIKLFSMYYDTIEELQKFVNQLNRMIVNRIIMSITIRQKMQLSILSKVQKDMKNSTTWI